MKYRNIVLIAIVGYILLWGPFLAIMHCVEDYGLKADPGTWIGKSIKVVFYPHYMFMAYCQPYFNYSIWSYNMIGKSSVKMDWGDWKYQVWDYKTKP